LQSVRGRCPSWGAARAPLGLLTGTGAPVRFAVPRCHDVGARSIPARADDERSRDVVKRNPTFLRLPMPRSHSLRDALVFALVAVALGAFTARVAFGPPSALGGPSVQAVAETRGA